MDISNYMNTLNQSASSDLSRANDSSFLKSNKSLNQIRPVGNKVILPALNHRSVFELPPAAMADPIFKMPGEQHGKTAPL